MQFLVMIMAVFTVGDNGVLDENAEVGVFEL